MREQQGIPGTVIMKNKGLIHTRGQKNVIKNLHTIYFLLRWKRGYENLSSRTQHGNVHHHNTEVGMETALSGKEQWQEILDRALDGETDQLGRVFQEYLRPKIYPFAVSLLQNQADAEDVVQETFERLLLSYQKIRRHDLKGFEAFVNMMVKNFCRDLWKKQRPREQVSEHLATTTTPHEDVARQGMVAALCTAIQQELTDIEQQIFELKVIEELPYRAISTHTGIPVTSLYRYYHDIIRKIDTDGELRASWEDIQGK